jgi:hypothetical protein
MPGRRSTPVRSIILLQRAAYRSELRIELRADALNCGDGRNAMPLAITDCAELNGDCPS